MNIICMYVHNFIICIMYEYMYVKVYVYIIINIYMYVCAYVCNVCMDTYTHMDIYV